jgi:predicted branched-subunit amino acid permease
MNLLNPVSRTLEKTAFLEALRVGSQTIPGLLAWGLVTGMAMVQSGLSLWQALLMTFTVYAGSAQLAVLPLIAAAVPASIIFLTAVLVNLRFVIFSAVLAPHFSHLRWYQRLVCGYFHVDMMMGVFPRRFPGPAHENRQEKLGYFVGLAVPTWSSWQVGSVAGMLLASQIPPSWGIGFAGTLALLTITIPLIKNWAAVAGVVVAGVVAVLAISWPYRLGLVVAIFAGIAAAMLVDHYTEEQE